jgi:hypothetical protein
MTDPVIIPQTPALSRLPNVEVMKTGRWDIATGTATFTSDDLHDAVAALSCPAVRRPILKLGHSDPRFDGEPCVGWIDHLAVIDDGATLVGDYAGMPGWLGGVLASAYPDRSCEGEYDYRCQLGHVHPFVVHAVALLGVSRPGIGTLESLQDVASLYGVAAKGSHLGTPVSILAKGSSPVPDPYARQVAASVTAEDVRRAFYDSPLGSGWDCWVEELQLDPLQLIFVKDTDSTRCRVPVIVGTGEGVDGVTFGDPVPVLIRYVDAAAALPGRDVITFAYQARAVRAAAVGSHSTATSDGAWDAGAHKKRLPADAGASTYRKMFAWQDPDGDADTQAAYKFPHHEVSAEGAVGAANTTACSAGIAALNGGRGGASIPSADRSGVHAHLAKHLRDAGKDVPDLTSASIAAGVSGERTPMTDEQLAVLRSALKLPDDADQEAVTAAMIESLAKPADPPADPAPDAPAALPEGTVAVDQAKFDQLVAAAARGEQARAQQERDAREAIVTAAIKDGRIAPVNKDHWIGLLERDPEGHGKFLASMPANTVPVAEIGHSGGAATAEDELYQRLWGVPAGMTTEQNLGRLPRG